MPEHSISFKHVLTDDPASLLNPIAWQVQVFDAKQSLLCDVINHGNGAEFTWWEPDAELKMSDYATKLLPDSIDPLRDYLDQLIETYHDEKPF